MNRLILFLIPLLLLACKEKEACICGPIEVPYYKLPAEMDPFFPFPGKELLYIFQDSLTGETELVRLKYSQIAGSLYDCGWDCTSTLQYECDCQRISFESDSLIGRSSLRVDPREDVTRINFYREKRGNLYLDHYSPSEQIGNVDLSFKDSVVVAGQTYREVMSMLDQKTNPMEYWFSTEGGLLKIKLKDAFTLERIGIEVVE
ncbi:MAG: hypothetical protein AAF206_02975 [Bacteroidota bacterium]